MPAVVAEPPTVAQEPPALRPRTDSPPDAEALKTMLLALEALLADLPASPVDTPAGDAGAVFHGVFLRDWRQLDSNNAFHDRVRRCACLPVTPMNLSGYEQTLCCAIGATFGNDTSSPPFKPRHCRLFIPAAWTPLVHSTDACSVHSHCVVVSRRLVA